MIRASSGYALEAAGYVAITAEGAEQALSREQDDLCDVAIVDLKLPGINGIALLEKLLHRHPHLPVLILTARFYRQCGGGDKGRLRLSHEALRSQRSTASHREGCRSSAASW